MTYARFSIMIIFLLSILGHPMQGQVCADEKKIIAAVDHRTSSALDLLRQVVNINSGTMNFAGVRKVGNIFIEELKAIGFETSWFPGESFNRAGHLVAVHHGKKGPKILLIGHLDTVFETDSPFQSYTMLNDSIMNGPGASDMKGGDVVMILAMQALKDAGLLDDLSIEIVMTGDEELSGDPIEMSKKAIIDAAKRADIALGYEDGDGLSTTAVISRRGSEDWTLTVKGTPSHSSQIFTEKVGTGAIYEASRILNEFYLQLSKEENLTINPGVIEGGTTVTFDDEKNAGTAFGKNNVVAQDVFVRGDLRTFSTNQLERARKIMNDIVTANYPGTSATLVFEPGGYPPMSLSEGNKKLLGHFNKVSLDLGYGPVVAVNPRRAGAADISFAADLVDMAMDGIGLPGGDGHTIHEKGNLDYLSIEAKRSAVLIYRLTHDKTE